MAESFLSLHPLQASSELPSQFNDPFDYEPHPLCLRAADEVQHYIASQPELLTDAQHGKMFGVLVVKTATLPVGSGRSGNPDSTGLFFLAAYSGLLAGRNDWPYFVPPVFDAQQPDGHFKQTERYISSLNAQVSRLQQQLSTNIDGPSLSVGSSAPRADGPSLSVGSSAPRADGPLMAAIHSIKQQRKQCSEELQNWLFQQYRMLNAQGEEKDLVEIWRDYHSSPKIQQRFPLPPGGSGDCCAPKLLQYAFQHQLQPVAIAEFWYGESPKGEIRHHGHYYPACRGKCLPILTFMLKGLDVKRRTPTSADCSSRLLVLYEDETLLVVDKPSGLLSVPGRIDAPSVEGLLSAQYGEVWMPHRLDMDTSGLLVVARTEDAYKQLQQQFYARTIFKRYVAIIEKTAETDRKAGSEESSMRLHPGDKGTISLPLRPDPLDRPRQVVDYLHGKQATTDYEILAEKQFASSASSGSSVSSASSASSVSSVSSASRTLLVSLTPHTGRTHQLRVHCAHPDGLDAPIVGDNLYGRKAHRLCLHAAEIMFTHPVSGERMHFQSKADFS